MCSDCSREPSCNDKEKGDPCKIWTDEQNAVTELPQIVFQKTKIIPTLHEYINLEVRGQTLDECRKHFDQILGGVKSE
jgi:hypothetical protein